MEEGNLIRCDRVTDHPWVGGLVGKLSDASGFSRFLIPRVLYKTTISPGQGIDMSEFQLSGIETPPINMCTKRRKVRLIDGNAKYRDLKKLYIWTLRQVFIWPRTPYAPPYTLLTCIHLFTQ